MLYLLVEKENLIPIGIENTENSAKRMAPDGDYFIVPIQEGIIYKTIVDIDIPGTVSFSKTDIDSELETTKQRIQDLESRLDILENNIQPARE